MNPLSNKLSVRNLVEICAAKNLEYVVISPGSRNAPLNISFNEHSAFTCLSIPDERSAAFIALGIAQQTRIPAIIHCTSGSAALNYAPAIAEAYIQKIPMLIITADRPEEWIGQGEGQSILQKNVYQNYIHKSYHLHLDTNDTNHEWSNSRMICEAIDLAKNKSVPVHINMPFREPLYEKRDYKNSLLPKITTYWQSQNTLSPSQWLHLTSNFSSNKTLILCGLLPQKNSTLNKLLNELATQNTVVLAETTSNVTGTNIYNNIDALLNHWDKEALRPELLITIGHSFISKKLKLWLREYSPKQHWHIGKDEAQDVFQCLSLHIPVTPQYFFENVSISHAAATSYLEDWSQKYQETQLHHQAFIKKCTWSDFKAFSILLPQLPKGTYLQMGNSSPVRYIQLFPTREDISYYANRGVSGIDGSTSTAVGAALVREEPTVLITGDIAFFYDSNAFWNAHLSSNLRVIIINNQGGGIFRLISGPPSTNQLEQYFETTHSHKAKGICDTFNIPYYFANNEENLQQILPSFFVSQKQNRPAVLEIQTPRKVNDVVFKDYFKKR